MEGRLKAPGWFQPLKPEMCYPGFIKILLFPSETTCTALRSGVTPGLTARQAASAMRMDMEDLREAAETAAELSVAEKIARAELIRRNERLGREVGGWTSRIDGAGIRTPDLLIPAEILVSTLEPIT
jgi:FtsZ-binding cell division protein ZapB